MRMHLQSNCLLTRLERPESGWVQDEVYKWNNTSYILKVKSPHSTSKWLLLPTPSLNFAE
jgi:hypothetical protein